jgi:gliding motility-associated-like protein
MVKKRHIISCLFFFNAIKGLTLSACNVTPSFSSYKSHACGLPNIIHANNTSTGTYKNTAKYWWKIDRTIASDTIAGTDSIKLLLKQAGTHSITLYVKDSAGCIDSSTSNYTVSTNAKPIMDQGMTYSYNPVWTNCIQFTTDPDTFRINLEAADTLRNLRIFWGDGSSDISGGSLAPNTVKTHLYASLGIFTVRIVSSNGSCTDTIYGTVYSQRQPTAGIIGPPSGSNRGCVPHTLRIVNNSYNISDNTTFRIEWGEGEVLNLPYTSYMDTLYHTYRAGICSGIIKITATNVCGSSFSTWNPIDISDVDSSRWSVVTTCDPTQPYRFRNEASDNYCLMPDIKSFYWDFGDGTNSGWSSSKADQLHTYKKEGDYFVTLIARTGCGNDTFINRVRVFFNPAAGFNFTSDNGCKPLSVSLTDTSKGRGITRLWTVIEGSSIKTFSDSILNYTFTGPGSNSISLRVTNPCGSSTLSKTFRVNDKPTASFANISGTCIPMLVNFSNTTSSYFSNPVYAWDFGDGTSSSLKNPASKTYTSAGNYTVTLIVSDSCGIDTFMQSFTAYGLPVAVLPGDTAGCTFDSLSFHNQSVNSNSFDWDFGDNQTLSSSQPGITRHMYSVPGNFTVRLISGTGSGCKDTTYLPVHIRPGAKAQFDIDRNFGCSPATFRFSNSTIYGKDYRWYANGKLISTGNVPSDTSIFTDSTVVNLKLIATSTSSCQGDSLEKAYFTAKNPKAVIGNQDSGCGLLKVTFNNQSSGHVSNYWDLGNGTTSTLSNPVMDYRSALKKDTFYYPELKVSNWAGCRDSAKTRIKVYPGPTAAFSMNKDKGCGPLAVSFTNLSSTNNNDPSGSLTNKWYFGTGSQSAMTDPDFTFLPNAYRDTVYTVSLKTTTINGCYDSTGQEVKVYPLPYIRFTADKTSGCAVLPVNFTNFSSPMDTGSISIMSFSWNSGNGKTVTGRNFNASYNGSANGDTVYNAVLTGFSEHGCRDTAVLPITVHPQPVAKFTLNNISGCTPLHVSTQNQSVSMDGGPLTHNWNFGNGYFSSNRDDSTIYINNSNADAGHLISYQAISQYGCRDTATQSLTVRPKPVAKFTVSSKKTCAPAIIKVTDNSVNGARYFWGEGQNKFTGTATENFNFAGLKLFDTLYIISHQVASPYGCLSDTVYEQVQVMARPQADFEFGRDSVCSAENISLVNNSLGGFRYVWKFGDNTSSNLVNPKHKFPLKKGGDNDTAFNVSLEVSSSFGCKDTLSRPIYLINKATDPISLDKTFGCTDLTVTMGQSSDRFSTLSWDFGDNSNRGSGDTVTHTYVNPIGNLSIQPRVALYRQRYNCRDTAYANVLVYPKPAADFVTLRNDPCDAGVFQLINKSKNGITNEWTVDSVTYSASNFSIILPSAVNNDTFYNVKLVVSNNYKCTDTIEHTIKVKPKLQIKFHQKSPLSCEKGTVDFTNMSINSVRHFWKFGDGGVSNEENPSYVYNRYGTYKIMLYGYDRDGCVDSSDGKTFYKVLEKPLADFTYLPVLPKLPNAIVNFTATPAIVTANVNDLVYEWDFGDNSFPTANKNIMNPSHTFTQAGVANVKLTVWNQICSDVIIKPIFIEDPKPIVDFTPDTLAGCAPFAVRFNNKTTNVTSYRWIFGDGSPDSYDREPTHIFEYAGTWDVTLIATGTGGTTTLSKKFLITTYPKPFVDFYTNYRFLSLPNAVFNLQNISNTVANEWTIYDSVGNIIQASTMRDPSFYVNQPGRLTVQLIGTNSYGCTDTLVKTDYLSTMGEGYVYVPSAFSPNKNGRNDDFKPSLHNVRSTNYSFRIYNRWGEKLFETTNINAKWDGTFKGEPCQQDVYIWTVNGEYINADLFAFRGTVTLLK